MICMYLVKVLKKKFKTQVHCSEKATNGRWELYCTLLCTLLSRILTIVVHNYRAHYCVPCRAYYLVHRCSKMSCSIYHKSSFILFCKSSCTLLCKVSHYLIHFHIAHCIWHCIRAPYSTWPKKSLIHFSTKFASRPTSP